MSFDADDEVLQDFLVEAGEILEQLNEQLVELEQRADDADLLNAVFRGFHTIKGGASFLALTPLVELCHRAEDVFNALRNGERAVDAQLMDVVLPVLDFLNAMFDSLRAGEQPDDADPETLRKLELLLDKNAAPAVAETTAAVDAADVEFEAMLGNIPQQTGEAAAAVEAGGAASGDEITDEEFESLLDQLHGAGKFSGAAAGETVPSAPPPPAPTPTASGDDISDDEFEALLDQLHGKGAAPSGLAEQASASAAATGGAKSPPPPPPKPAAKPEAARAKAPQAESQAAAKVEVAKKAPAKDVQQGETTVRVDTKRLDDIMNLVGELVLVRNRLSTLQASVEDEAVSSAVSNLDVVTADLQMAVMKTRMQPIKKVFGRFPRVVRDLARSLKKEVQLVLEGEDTDLDKNLVEALADPLVHLVRNAVDHGIEMPDAREKAGKDRQGTVLLKAAQEGDHIELTIADDGGGMDPDVLRQKAVEKGIMDEEAASRLSNHDCYNLIFAPGFSTKAVISDISGRGVGMDVVKTRIVQLNGSVDIDSEKGKGSRLLIKVPLTLAIMPTLMVVLGKQIFALPLVNVCEIFDLDLRNTNVVDGQQVVVVRSKPVPLFYLSSWLVKGVSRDMCPDQGHVVIVALGEQRIGLVVDELVGQEEVVIKPLGAMLHGTQGLAGATITGDGRISLILDVPSLMKAYAHRY